MRHAGSLTPPGAQVPTCAARFLCQPSEKTWTVIRSPFIDKDSREQFEMRTHKRLIDVIDPTPQTMDELLRLQLAAGVDIELKS